MGHLRVSVLGPPQVRHGETTLAFPTQKALALLVYLAVEGGLQAREPLAALFWPESDQAHARAMLRYTLARLRKVLEDSAGAPHLVTERDKLGLHPASAVELDLERLRAVPVLARSGSVPELREVVERCRGQFLGGDAASLSLPDAPEFDQWVIARREAIKSDVDLLFDRLSQLESDGGHPTEALETVRRWLALNPLNEEAHRRLMRLYIAVGDRSAARRAYEACRALLEQEVHVPPAPETEALAELVAATPELAPATSREALAPGLLEGPLVGRTAEFTTLVERYMFARRGQTQVVIVQGEPGIGKTRLARDFVGWAAGQGADILQGRAFATGGRLPYQVLVDALRTRLECENAPEDLLSDVWLAELGRLLPELRDRYPDLPVAAAEEAPARLRLFEAIARLAEALASRAPVVLFVDDMQWADVGSLDALVYATQRWTESRTPLMALLGLRPEDVAPAAALEEWLTSGLARAATVTRVDLGPLTAEDTLTFIRGLAAGAERAEIEALARSLHTESGGLPLFVVETLRALIGREALVARTSDDGGWAIDLRPGRPDPARFGESMPPGMRELIHVRLARLAPAARDLLAAGSVLGQRFTFREACRVAGLSEEAGLRAMDDIVRVHLVREAGAADGGTAIGGYVFGHDRIRDVVYAEAGEARREVFHGRAVDALEGTASAARLAHHALAAGLDEPAVRFGGLAGDDAVRLLGARDAVSHYERALEIAVRREWRGEAAALHARCGKTLASLGRWVEARRELEAALEGLSADQAEQRGEVLVALLEVCWWHLDIAGLRQHAAEAVAVAEELDRVELKHAALDWLVLAISADGDLMGCIAQGEQVFARGRTLGLAPPRPVQAHLALPYYWLGQIGPAIDRSAESVRAAREANDASATLFALPNLGLSLASSGRYGEAERVFDEARRLGREYGIGTLLARAIAMSAGYHLDVSDFAEHEVLAMQANELARSLDFTPPAVSAELDLMMNFARRMEIGRAEALMPIVTEGARRASAWHGWLWTIRLAEAKAEIALARGDWEDALRWSGDALDESRVRGRIKYQVLALGTGAAALEALGRTRQSIAHLRRAVALARRLGDPALFLRVTTALLGLDGDDALAAETAATARRIALALPDARIRAAFEAATQGTEMIG